jgi:hypothetical protein
MLGGIVVRDDEAWFFKAVGPDEVLEGHQPAFRQLLESVRFSDGRPAWDLPDGWRQKAGSGMRFATIEFGPEDAELELSVIPMGVPDGDADQCILMNVNRWRDQMGIARLTADQIEEQTEAIPLDGLRAVFVDLKAEPASTPEPGALRFDVPDGWTEGDKEVTRMGVTLRHEAAFLVTDGEDRVEISVDRMPSGGTLLQNLPRWQAQIGLDTDPAETETLKIAGRDAEYVELTGQDQSILGAVVPGDGEAWYIKLKGANGLAKREKQNFRDFLQSIRFE